MSSSFKTIKEQAKALPPEERADLAHELITSLDDELDTDVESVWDKEIRRVLDLDCGICPSKEKTVLLAETIELVLDRKLLRPVSLRGVFCRSNLLTCLRWGLLR